MKVIQTPLNEFFKILFWILVLIGLNNLFNFIYRSLVPFSAYSFLGGDKIYTLMMLSFSGAICLWGMVKTLKKPEFSFLILIAFLGGISALSTTYFETAGWKISKIIIMSLIYFWINFIFIQKTKKKA